MTSWHSYPKVYAFGHPEAREVVGREVYVQEKIDGSQFSFGAFVEGAPGPVLRTRSKSVEFPPDEAPDLFRAATDTVEALCPVLHVGWTYRAEVLKRPKHNALAYARVPRGNLILFDVDVDLEDRLPYAQLADEAARLGLEVVPLLAQRVLEDPGQLTLLLDAESVLGGAKVEGVVVKPVHPVFGADKRAVMAKYVSEAYKELHGKEWKVTPDRDVLAQLVARYATERRWAKAVEHLHDASVLTGTPRDIGPLIVEVQRDVWAEERAAIAEALVAHFERRLTKGFVAGLPDWYKARLLAGAFQAEGAVEAAPS